MKNTSEYPTESIARSSRVPIKIKARLSIMTAFSFGYHLKHLTIHWQNHFKQAPFMLFLLHFTSHYATAKGYPEPKLMALLIVFQCQPLPESGIVLFRLLVAV
jgi:hypothetical protein